MTSRSNLRFDRQGFRPGRAAHGPAAHPRGASLGRRVERRRARGAREIEAWRADLWIGRAGDGRASRDGADQRAHEHRLVHVPYQGSPAQVTDLVAGRLSMALVVASTVMPHVEAVASRRSPRVRPGARASRQNPDHRGGLAARLRLHGLVRPDGTRRHAARGDRQARHRRQRCAQVGGCGRQARAAGFEPLDGSPDEFAQLIARGMVTWKAAAEAAGLKK